MLAARCLKGMRVTSRPRSHREMGGDIIWEVGSGYFGCRTPDGRFCPEKFAETAAAGQIKMVELKLSQGAKPGHGGVLPAARHAVLRNYPLSAHLRFLLEKIRPEMRQYFFEDEKRNG